MSISWWLHGISLILDWGVMLERPKKNDKILTVQVLSVLDIPHGIPTTLFVPENIHFELVQEGLEHFHGRPPTEPTMMKYAKVFRILLTLSDPLFVEVEKHLQEGSQAGYVCCPALNGFHSNIDAGCDFGVALFSASAEGTFKILNKKIDKTALAQMTDIYPIENCTFVRLCKLKRLKDASTHWGNYRVGIDWLAEEQCSPTSIIDNYKIKSKFTFW